MPVKICDFPFPKKNLVLTFNFYEIDDLDKIFGKWLLRRGLKD